MVYRPEAPTGKLDLVVDLNFRMDTSALYSDIVLPAATWYEKDDLNTTDLHSYINPMQAAVAPAWESKSDWDIYKAIAKRVSDLAKSTCPSRCAMSSCCRLQHDTPDELAQPEVRDWKTRRSGGDPRPDDAQVPRGDARLCPSVRADGQPGRARWRANGVAAHGLTIPVADEYDRLAQRQPRQVERP